MQNNKIAIISIDKVGQSMAGSGIRYYNLAKSLSQHFDVTLFVPGKCDLQEEDFQIEIYPIKKQSFYLSKKIPDYDYVISQTLRPILLKTLQKHRIPYIADLYDPLTIEVLELNKNQPAKDRTKNYNLLYAYFVNQILFSDHILYANDRQKHYYLGLLSAFKILNPDSYATSPNYDNFMTSLPFGIDANPPALTKSIIEEKFPQIKPSDKIILWGGGVWNWFDPLTVLKAFRDLKTERPDIKFLFFGTKHPNPEIKEMKMLNDAYDYAKKENLLNNNVFFNEGWVPYQERANYFLRASIGISTHFDNLETVFSFRTRVLDYLWAELPMILTQGDYFADFCQTHNLGKVVDYQNPAAIKTAIIELVDNQPLRRQIQTNIRQIKPGYYWSNLVLPLVNKINSGQITHQPKSKFSYYKSTFNFYKAILLRRLP